MKRCIDRSVCWSYVRDTVLVSWGGGVIIGYMVIYFWVTFLVHPLFYSRIPFPTVTHPQKWLTRLTC